MTTKEYQKATLKTAVYGDNINKLVDFAPKSDIKQILKLSYAVVGLANEAGEVAGKFKKMIRGDVAFQNLAEFKAVLADELSDVCWYLSQTCNELGISLEEVMNHNIKKLADRQKRGVLKGSGDKR